jgi:hypothetical protein
MAFSAYAWLASTSSTGVLGQNGGLSNPILNTFGSQDQLGFRISTASLNHPL